MSGTGGTGASSDTTELVGARVLERWAERGAILENDGFQGSVRQRKEKGRRRLNNHSELINLQRATRDGAMDPSASHDSQSDGMISLNSPIFVAPIPFISDQPSSPN